MSTKATPISQIKRRLEDMAGDLGGTRRYWDCVEALLDVAEVAQQIVSYPPFHNCRGPFCPLCIELPNRLADLREAQ